LLRLIGTLVEGPADTESPKTKSALARERPPQWRRRSHVGRD
jgi:hypothetical protein